jgi:peptide/nickel transport system permease protein
MPLLKFMGRRLLWATLVLVFVSFFSFLVIQLPPGDYLTSYLEQLQKAGMSVDDATMVSLRHSYGLDRPFVVQYWSWFTRFLQGDMGVSFHYSRKVSAIILERLPASLLIMSSALVIMYLVSIPLGIYAARHQYSVGDFATALLGFLGMATPGFLLGLLLMWLGYAWFGLSIGGLQSPYFLQQPMSWAKFWDLLKHLPIPICVITVAGIANLMRTMRGTLLDELGKQYVVTARAKGLREGALIRKYPVRAALNPIISSGGWLLAELFSGETVTSIVLGLPTLGPVLYRALLAEDMFLAASCVMVMSMLTILGFLISDIALALVDPRIRMN